ncbi:MAG: glutamine synthetase [Clostridia bacterium]|nr:glutamine synthetase [Clostridia bacterium]
MKSEFVLNKNLIYAIPTEKCNKESLIELLNDHKEIKFVSFVGIDLWGNDTDEKIPVDYFIDNIDDMLEFGIQTDGSSVNLAKIAILSDARVDLIPDKDSTWYVDYNYENIDTETNLPTGTLRIWSFLLHNGEYVDSRFVLKSSVEKVKKYLLKKIDNKDLLNLYNIDSINDVENIEVMLGTELEFWVRTPYDKIDVEELVLSQKLKEQYWKRTKGIVRTALEQTLQILDLYGLKPEMGHKEVGGVKTYISGGEKTDNHIVEQLEIDWKYNKILRTADSELLARIIIKEVFRLHGLEVSFNAKPIIGVAGSGEHCHFSFMLKLKNGKSINLLASTEEKTYLSKIGWGMLMGILKNYDLINPFVANTNDAFNRLKPGYEAPTHVVASIGNDFNGETRNRTVLVGLVKDKSNPLSTRLEVRSPNPKTNLFLATSVILAGMLDGIEYCLQKDLTNNQLEQEVCKNYESNAKYLSKEKIYREEHDIFDVYTNEERDKYFGKPPKTVYENIDNLKDTKILEKIIDKKIIEAHIDLSIKNWILDLKQRIIPENRKTILSYTKLKHFNRYDRCLWKKIYELKQQLAKDEDKKKSIISKIIIYAEQKDYKQVSDLQLEMDKKMEILNELYIQYKNNNI